MSHDKCFDSDDDIDNILTTYENAAKRENFYLLRFTSKLLTTHFEMHGCTSSIRAISQSLVFNIVCSTYG